MITITQQPDDKSLNSANNDLYFVVSGATEAVTGNTDYKFTADVYIDTELVCTLKSFPDPDLGYGVFNLRNIPTSFLKNDIDFDVSLNDTTTSLFYEVPSGSCELVLQFGEEYLNSSGVFVSNRNVTQSNQVYFINASLDFLEQNAVPNFSYFYTVHQDYDDPDISSGFFLGSAVNNNYESGYKTPTWTQIRQYLYFFLNEDSRFDLKLRISTYDREDNFLGYYETDAHHYSSNTGLKYVAVGYTQLANLSPANYTVLSGNPSLINSDVYSYNVQLNNTSPGNALGFSSPTFYLKENCTEQKKYNVHWLTRFGSFNSWRFDKKSVEKITKTQSDYKKIYGSLSSNGTYSVNNFDRNTQTYYTSIENNLALSSDFLKENQVLYLKDLFTSPVIYIEDLDTNGSPVIVSATITDNDYTLNKRKNSKIFSLVLNFKLAYNDYRQLC